jgi:hypothetical protein
MTVVIFENHSIKFRDCGQPRVVSRELDIWYLLRIMVDYPDLVLAVPRFFVVLLADEIRL